jgi:ubiquinone biosynthesis protein COQ9
MDKTDVQTIKDRILRAALLNVPFEGWHWNVIEKSAVDAGYDAQMARAVFPTEIKDALVHFSDLADREMLRTLEGVDSKKLKVRERIREAVLARYEYLKTHREALRGSVQFWMLPTRKPRASKILWHTADCIWDWAGDEATDYNRYTKRSLLCVILASTTLVFLNDTNDRLDNTKAFLDRRIENVMQLGKILGKFSRKA